MSKIKSRKHEVTRQGSCDPRKFGMVIAAALPGLVIAAQQPEPADGTQTLSSIRVQEEVEEGGYKVDRPSSPKFTAPLADIPQTITVIPKELLADQGVGTLAEALRNTPGITFTLGENGNTTAGDSITMRGFDTSSSIFLDGVRDLGAVSRDTFNVEAVEVVKGPSGSDNGRGAPTGYINQVTKQATLESAIGSTLAFGTDSRLRFTGDVNHAIGSISGAALRLNVMYDKADKPGRRVAGNERWGIAPSFSLGLGGDTRVHFNYLHVEQSNVPDGGLPAIGLPGFNFASPTTGATAVPPELVPAVNAAINGAAPVDTKNFYGSLDDFEDVSANMFTVKLEHDMSQDTTVRNTSRYGRYTLQRELTGIITLGNYFTGSVVNDPSVWTVSRSRQRRDEVNEVLTNQTNLTTAFATGAVGHSFSTGVEFIYERQLLRGSASTGTTAVANLYNPNTADSFATLARSGQATDGKMLTAAAYVFDTLQFGERWRLNLGARFDHYELETATVPAPATPPAASTFLQDQGNLFTGKVGLVFKPLPNGSIYINYANSQQPPGGASLQLSAGTATNANNYTLDPQEATNIELGTKWELLDNRLVLTAAAFDTRNKNDTAQVDTLTGEIVQFGERKVRGIELGAAGMITPNWQVSAGVASMDTEVVAGTAAAAGAQLQFSPRLTFTSWTTYTLPFGLTIGGGARYTDSQFRNGNATQATVTNLAVNPEYWVVDAMAKYALNERVSLQFNAYNLLDEFYMSSLNSGGSRYMLGAPRSYQLSGTINFK